MRRPYYRRDRKKWFVKTDDGSTQVYLGETKTEAYTRWEQMRRSGMPTLWTVGDLVTAFLDDAIARGCISRHTDRLRLLLTPLVASFPRTRAADLRPSEVVAWLAGKSTWGPTTRSHAASAIRSAFRFAVAEGIIPASPFAGLRQARGERVAAAITSSEHWRLLKACGSREERAYIHALYLTGARPGEIAGATAADLGEGVLRIPKHKTQKKGKSRNLILSPRAELLLRQQAEAHPKGPLFRARSRKAWCKASWTELFRRLRERTKIAHATAYAYRRGFAERGIAAGLSIEQVAGLLGNTTTVALRHYVDIREGLERLRDAARRV
jgi:integrase